MVKALAERKHGFLERYELLQHWASAATALKAPEAELAPADGRDLYHRALGGLIAQLPFGLSAARR